MPVGRATIEDIARALNVTPSTVSRALNGHAAISEATKTAVARTAKKLNYRPNKIASSLRLGTTQIIGVIIPSAEINFFGSVVHGIERVASENNYSVLLFQSNEQTDFERKGIETFMRSRVDGVLASISKNTTNLDHYLELRKRGVPLIFFDRVNEDLAVPSVVVDDYRGAYNATCHLIEQGCSRIAHIAGQQHISIFKKRLEGYVAALRDNNLPVRESLIRYGEVTIDSGAECMKALMRLKEPPDGVFAVEDFTALGALQSLKTAGVSVPGEVALIGFANEAFGEYITPSLSTVDQQTIKMGEAAAKLFFELSGRKSFYRAAPKRVVLEPKLVFRTSSLRLVNKPI